MSEPTATGNLEATPLSQLLVYALDKRLTGSFIFQTPDRQKTALYCAGGAPAKAKTGQPVIHLGRLLLELGKIDEDTYNKTLTRVATERKLHGQLLIEVGAIDQETLDAALAEQLLRQVVWMFSLGPKTAYAYYNGKDFLDRWGGGPVQAEPLAMLWRGIRRYENVPRVDAALARLGQRVLKLHQNAQLVRFGFGDAERPVLDVIRAKPQPMTELLDAGISDVVETKRLLYALMITRHLDIGAAPLGIGGASAAPPARAAAASPPPAVAAPPPPARGAPPPPPRAPETPPPPSVRQAPPVVTPSAAKNAPPPLASSPIAALIGSSPAAAPPPSPRASAPAGKPVEPPQVAELRRELETHAERMPHQNYYEMLGVPVKSASAEISAAFFQLAKKWHPDRLGPEFGSLKDEVVTFFAKMTEAHQVLTDDERRRNYDELVKDGGGTEAEQQEVNKIMNAVVAYQKATVYYRKGNLAEAEELAKQAMEGDKEQGEYVALWVQCVAQRPERAAKGDYRDLIALMDNVVKKEGENEKVRMARGDLLKRAGKLEQAQADFRYVARYFPKNLEAAREVRLFTMRGGEAPPAESKRSIGPAKGKDKEEKGGLLGKLFKR